MTIPVIGIPCGRAKSRGADQPQMTVPLSYLHALIGAGAAPIMIPLELPANALDSIAAH